MRADARVVLLGLDGFPSRVVRPDLTPNLWSLASEGGSAPEGGRCELPSSTYPGFASLLTGRLPRGHGVRTTGGPPGAVPGWAGSDRVRVPSLFDACRRSGRRSGAVLGDHFLHAVLRTGCADVRWPPSGSPPPGAALDAHGYAVNEEVLRRAIPAVADPGLAFVFVHLNEADTVGHDLGPDHPSTIACYRETDRAIGVLLGALRGDWEQALVVVVSDHGMEARSDRPPLDLVAELARRGVEVDAVADGGAALIRPRPAPDDPVELEPALAEVPGVARWTFEGDLVLLVEAEPGWIFSPPGDPAGLPAGGYHGGAATADTVAVVGGGHPAADEIGRSLVRRRPHLADWAPTIAGVLGLSMPEVDGVDLRGAPGPAGADPTTGGRPRPAVR